MTYEIVRCKRKRTAVCIKDGRVVVKAPASATKARIDEFVRSKSDWITKKLAEYDKKAAALGGALDYTEALIAGVLVPVIVSEKHKSVKLADGALFVPVKNAADVKKAVGSWYKRTAKKQLAAMLEQTAKRTGLTYASFALTNARTQWGSCDGKCNIRLNWRLLMIDEAAAEYVIIHELCHTLHHDHSAAFWAEVKRLCPSVAEQKKRLKAYTPLMALYR